MMPEGRHRIRIIYKSGVEVSVTCDKFAVTRNPVNGVRSFEWENLHPHPLLMGADDIESVWQES